MPRKTPRRRGQALNAPISSSRLSASLQDLLDTRDRNHDAWLEPASTTAFDLAVSGPSEVGATRWARARTRARRTPPEQRSLFGEILDWMFVPMMLLWPLSVVITFLLAQSLADVPFDRALIERTEALARQATAASDTGALSLPRSVSDFVAAGEDNTQVYLQVIAPRGRLMVGQPDLPPPRLYDYPEPGRVKLRTATYRGNDVRIGYLYLDDGQAEDGAPMLVQVAETLDKRTRLANEIIKGVIFPQFMILPVAVTLVWFGLSRGLKPLKALQGRIRSRAPNDLSPIDPRGAPEEIAPLVDAFNDQIERLGRNIDSQRRFVASAAHQMKTPLAGLRTQAELALREQDPEQLRQRLEQIALGSQRASRLISQLLALARTENQGLTATLVLIDLHALARDVVGEWVPMAVHHQIDLGFEGEHRPIRIQGHELLLREMLNNLIDNALRYTPRGGAATVRLETDGAEAVLTVEDTGPGIPEVERDLVFERFHRVLGTNVDGSGLGLAIVKEIVEQHSATITITDALTSPDPAQRGASPHGARFVVRFAESSGAVPRA